MHQMADLSTTSQIRTTGYPATKNIKKGEMSEHSLGVESFEENAECLWKPSEKRGEKSRGSAASQHGNVLGMCFCAPSRRGKRRGLI